MSERRREGEERKKKDRNGRKKGKKERKEQNRDLTQGKERRNTQRCECVDVCMFVRVRIREGVRLNVENLTSHLVKACCLLLSHRRTS